MTSLLVSASSLVVRAGLEAVVSSNPAILLLGASPGPPDLYRRIDETQPDVVLFEADSRDQDLSSTLRTIAAQNSGIVLLVDDAGPHYVKAGARGVLPHGASEREILAAIEAVAAGLIVMPPELLEPAGSSHSPGERVLTAREIEVLRMLAEGLANKEIAWRLGLSEHTVKFHVTQVFNKLNVSSRTEAVTAGLRQGLILL